MNESLIQIETKEVERNRRVGEIITLAKGLSEGQEALPFPGVNPDDYSRMKKDEEEFPGFTTPVDELIERFKSEGLKVVLGAHPESGNVFVLPAQSDNIEMDSISPRQLQISESIDGKLKELILACRSFLEFTRADRL